MCLHTLQQTPLVAEYDIIVYKIMFPVIEGCFSSLHQEFIYKPNQLYKAEYFGKSTLDDRCANYKEYFWWNSLPVSVKLTGRNIGEGFHSYKDKYIVDEIDGPEKIVECVVPKDSLYYDNPVGLMVSNQIIIKQIILI